MLQTFWWMDHVQLSRSPMTESTGCLISLQSLLLVIAALFS